MGCGLVFQIVVYCGVTAKCHVWQLSWSDGGPPSALVTLVLDLYFSFPSTRLPLTDISMN